MDAVNAGRRSRSGRERFQLILRERSLYSAPALEASIGGSAIMKLKTCLTLGACFALALVLILAAWSLAAQGRSLSMNRGVIQGTVTGMKGKSVVYVEAIAGKTFQAPAKHAVIDQKELIFIPHILAIQKGTAVDFLNSDNVQHNVFWPSI